MLSRSEVARSLKGLWVLGKGERQGMLAFDTSARGVLNSFQALIWALPATFAYLILSRWEFLSEMPDADRSSVDFFVKAGSIEVAASAVTPLAIFLCVPLLRMNVSPSALVVVANWAFFPASYVSTVVVYLSYGLDHKGHLGLIISLILLLGTAIVLFAWLGVVLKTASGARSWQIFFLLTIVVGSGFFVTAYLESIMGLSTSFEYSESTRGYHAVV